MNEDYVNGEMLENFSNYNKSSDYPLVWISCDKCAVRSGWNVSYNHC